MSVCTAKTTRLVTMFGLLAVGFFFSFVVLLLILTIIVLHFSAINALKGRAGLRKVTREREMEGYDDENGPLVVSFSFISFCVLQLILVIVLYMGSNNAF